MTEFDAIARVAHRAHNDCRRCRDAVVPYPEKFFQNSSPLAKKLRETVEFGQGAKDGA
jgi:hypothetical protein